jgi:hypothetical protein
VKENVEKSFPQIFVKINDLALAKLYYFKQEVNFNETFPRLGSFEIYLNEFLVFSKISRRSWPKLKNILGKIEYLVSSDVKNSRILRTNTESTGARVVIRNLKLKDVRPSSFLSKCKSERLSVKASANRSILTSKNSAKDLKITKKIKKKEKKLKFLTPGLLQSTSQASLKSNKSNFSVISEVSERKKFKFPKDENFKTFVLKILVNQEVHKKFKVFNESDEVKTVQVEANDVKLVFVKTPELTLLPKNSDYIKFICLPNMKVESKTVIITLNSHDVTFFAYILEIEYINNE